MANLLLEIGTEELPAGYIGPALASLREGFIQLLVKHGFLPERIAAPGETGVCGEVMVTGTGGTTSVKRRSWVDRRERARGS